MYRLLLGLVVVASTSLPASASLISRLGGQAVYDTDFDITWIANANLALSKTFGIAGIQANGVMTYHTLVDEWMPALNAEGGTGYLGFNDWRLPATLQPDPTCGSVIQGNVDGGYNCTGSEAGHLYYDELGGTASVSILLSGDPDLALFQNLDKIGDADGIRGIWSTTCCEDVLDDWAYYFYFDFEYPAGDLSGIQGTGPKTFEYFVPWLVRDGDVVGTAPEPSTVLLFGSGFVALVQTVRRRGRGGRRVRGWHP